MLEVHQYRDGILEQQRIFDRPGTIRIGRHQECEIHIRGQEISRFHMHLEWDGRLLRAFNDSTKNGTLLNGRPLSGEGEWVPCPVTFYLSAQVSICVELTSPDRVARIPPQNQWEGRPMEEAGPQGARLPGAGADGLAPAGAAVASPPFAPSSPFAPAPPSSIAPGAAAPGEIAPSSGAIAPAPVSSENDALDALAETIERSDNAPPPPGSARFAIPRAGQAAPQGGTPFFAPPASPPSASAPSVSAPPSTPPKGSTQIVPLRGKEQQAPGTPRRTQISPLHARRTPAEAAGAAAGPAPPPVVSQERSLERIARHKERPLDESARLLREIHHKLVDRLNTWRWAHEEATQEESRRQAERILGEIIEEYKDRLPPDLTAGRLKKDVLDLALGLGPIEDLLHDPSVSEIMVVGCDRVYVERGGLVELTDRSFASNEILRSYIDAIVRPLGRRVDEGSPMVDARLPDGSRINAVIPPLSPHGPCLTIRKFRQQHFTLEELARLGTLNPRMALFLERCVKARKNIVVSGGTGSGKTTLLNTFSSYISERERIVTIEDALELRLQQKHVITLECRPPNTEGKGQVTVQDLLRNALRMRPDRIIIGECRGEEALDMIQAMNTGHDGSLTTLHANSPEDMLRRLEIMILKAKEMPIGAIREMIASAIHVVEQQTAFRMGGV